MKILVVGSGGREHALAWKLSQDSSAPTLFCAPGNAGTASIATNVPIGADDIDALVNWADENDIGFVVVGPEIPLCLGLVDRLAEKGIRAFGPDKAGAEIEGSKVFSKDVMKAGGVPAAASESFTNYDEALTFARSLGAPLVIKAEGLAAGKGVTVCESMEQAENALKESLIDGLFGDAGSTVLVEEFLPGEEASIFALTDGESIVLLASSQDHKRIGEGDTGPNTGGMGAYSPAPVVKADMWPAIREQVFERTLAELKRRGITYKGVLYAGLMIDDGVLKVLEFNCRFGDPETQCVLSRIDGDLLPALMACADGTLTEDLLSWSDDPAVVIVMAAGGYPGAYAKGTVISGLEAAAEVDGTIVLHAGTAESDGHVSTSGGRVLGVTARGADLKSAVDRAYRAVEKISFEGAQYRRDIGHRALT